MIRPFKAFVQMILPLAYEDSLSYMELLSKVVYKLNEVIEQDNSLAEAVNTLQGIIDGYEIGTMVEEEVERKLDEMVANGTLADLVNSSILDKPKLIKNSNGAVNRVLKCAGSYIRNDVAYGNFNGALNTNCIMVNGKWVIDCSTFAQLVAMGISFENSRYSGKPVNVGIGGMNIPVSDMDITPNADRPYGMLSGNFARWCYRRGYYYVPTTVWDIEPGDVVFINTGLDTVFEGISHCAVALCAYDDYVITIEANDTTPCVGRRAWKLGGGLNQVVGCARLPYLDMESEAEDLFNNPYNLADITAPVTATINAGQTGYIVKQLNIKNPLENGQPYTIWVESNLDSFERFQLLGQDSKNYGAFMPFKQYGNVAYRVFYPNEYETILNQGPTGVGCYRIPLQVIIPRQNTNYVKTYTFKSIKLFRGVVLPSDTKPVNDGQHLYPIATYENEADFVSAADALTTVGPDQSFKPPVILRLTNSGATIDAGRYAVFTILFGSTLAVGTQILIPIGKGTAYARYSAGTTWNTFEPFVIHT